MTRKWTRTVSPALNGGVSRSCRRSSSWIVVLMIEKGPGGALHGSRTRGAGPNAGGPTHSPPTLPGGKSYPEMRDACVESSEQFRETVPGGNAVPDAGPSLESAEDRHDRDPRRRPVRRDHLADQVLARHRAPLARVARLAAVVAHEEVLALRHDPLVVLVVGVVLDVL